VSSVSSTPPVFTKVDGRIATVTLSSPGKLNALSKAHWDSLGDAFVALAADRQVRAIVVRGADGNFAAGADISEFSSVRANAEQGTRYHEVTIARALNAVAHCPKPTLALIEGACVGGGLEIACSCDLRIAARSARFGVPIMRLGFPLAHREMMAMLSLVSPAVALEILLEGRVFPAEEAHQKGLLTRVVDDVEVVNEAYAAATRMAAGSPRAARANKALVRRLKPLQSPLTAREVAEHYQYFESADYQVGVRAFLAKTKPEFEDS
jgi:enoyl-CoA hydratase/carnithine racemase